MTTSIVPRRWVATLVMALAWSCPGAQEPASPPRAITMVMPPFVIRDDSGSTTGFSTEIWNEVARRLDIAPGARVMPDTSSVLEALRSHGADIVVSGAYYSSERDREFDFSYPILESGQRILVRADDAHGSPNLISDLLGLMLSSTFLLWIGVALLFNLVPAHVIWFLERRRKDGIIVNRNYFPGIFEAMSWAASTLLTQAEQIPRHGLARWIGILWMFVGIIFVADYTAELTTRKTVREIQGAIRGPHDLPGKRVGTLAGSVAAGYLRAHYALVQEFGSGKATFQALLDKKVDAVVLDAEVLGYFAEHEGKGQVALVGPEFNKGDLGFVFSNNSPLRKKVNGALLGMREDGAYQRIHDKWFGTE